MLLDLVPLAIEFVVMVDGLLAIGFGGDARRDAAFGEGPAKPVGVIAFVAQKLVCFRQDGQHECGAFVIAHLAFAEQHDDGAPLTIAHGVQL